MSECGAGGCDEYCIIARRPDDPQDDPAQDEDSV